MCSTCIWCLVTGAFIMKSKEMQAEKTFIRLTEIKIKLREMVKKKKSIKWPTQQNRTVLKTTEENKSA